MPLTPRGDERRTRKLWDEESNNHLRRLCAIEPQLSVQKIGRLMDRAHGSVNQQIHKLGLRAPIVRGIGRPAISQKSPAIVKALMGRTDVVVKGYFDPWQGKFIYVTLPRLKCLEATT